MAETPKGVRVAIRIKEEQMRAHTENYKPKKIYGIETGRRKQHTGCCGRPRCQRCHPYKFPFRVITRKEYVQNLYSENE